MTLPEKLPGHWTTPDGAEMAKRYVDIPRHQLFGGDFTDFEAAHRVAMTMRSDLDFEASLALARDRIRWLSVQLALSNQEVARLKPESDMFRRAVGAADVFQNGGPLAYLLRLGDSTVVDGPPAAAKRIEDLTIALQNLLTSVKVAHNLSEATRWAEETIAKAGGTNG